MAGQPARGPPRGGQPIDLFRTPSLDQQSKAVAPETGLFRLDSSARLIPALHAWRSMATVVMIMMMMMMAVLTDNEDPFVSLP